jgi:hypothetical protein
MSVAAANQQASMAFAAPLETPLANPDQEWWLVHGMHYCVWLSCSRLPDSRTNTPMHVQPISLDQCNKPLLTEIILEGQIETTQEENPTIEL